MHRLKQSFRIPDYAPIAQPMHPVLEYFPPGVAPKSYALPREGHDNQQHHPTGEHKRVRDLRLAVDHTLAHNMECERVPLTPHHHLAVDHTHATHTVRTAAKWTADRGSQRLHLKADRLTECVCPPPLIATAPC